MLSFYREMDEIGVIAYYDCNKPPQCIWTDEEWSYLNWYKEKYRRFPTNITDESVCHPVIDILPNLQAVRCFGMSEINKTKIRDFENIKDLRNYYDLIFDSPAFRISADHACDDCYDRKTRQCLGGCIGFKLSKLQVE